MVLPNSTTVPWPSADASALRRTVNSSGGYPVRSAGRLVREERKRTITRSTLRMAQSVPHNRMTLSLRATEARGVPLVLGRRLHDLEWRRVRGEDVGRFRGHEAAE